jgi:hypothetical protein
MKISNLVASFILLNMNLAIAQIPQTSQMSSFTPSVPQVPKSGEMPRYDPPAVPMPDQLGQMRMGATAADILRQANRNNPNYGYGNDPASIQRANEAWIHRQMMDDPAYNPALRNGVSSRFQITKQQELHNLIQEAVNGDNNRFVSNGMKQDDFSSSEFASKAGSYTDALQTLKDMLNNKRNLSIALAYFTMETAYGESYLTVTEFKSILSESAKFIRQWMDQHKLNPSDNSSINYAVQQFMGETLTITGTEKNRDGKPIYQTIRHQPFSYDFGDYSGDRDHRNFFLTKCLATGSGQCNSMPVVYLSL